MKKIIALILSLGLFSAAASAAIPTGSEAPDFTLTDHTGTTHSLSDFRGQFVVLEWFNHECPFVVKHYREGHMQALQAKYAEKGVVWLLINSGAVGEQGYTTPEQAAAVISNWNMNVPILFDTPGTVGRLFGARTTPHMYIINPEGVLVYQGAIDSIRSARTADVERAENFVVSAFNALMAGESVENHTTQPYGCSVKYASN
jgi:peroxiredoxin